MNKHLKVTHAIIFPSLSIYRFLLSPIYLMDISNRNLSNSTYNINIVSYINGDITKKKNKF